MFINSYPSTCMASCESWKQRPSFVSAVMPYERRKDVYRGYDASQGFRNLSMQLFSELLWIAVNSALAKHDASFNLSTANYWNFHEFMSFILNVRNVGSF